MLQNIMSAVNTKLTLKLLRKLLGPKLELHLRSTSFITIGLENGNAYEIYICNLVGKSQEEFGTRARDVEKD